MILRRQLQTAHNPELKFHYEEPIIDSGVYPISNDPKENFMTYFEWKNEYSVKIARIDEEHQMLVGFLNELYESMKAGKGNETLKDVLGKLIQYTQNHFVTEENLMKRYNYPDYEIHRLKHQKMTEHVMKLKYQFDTGQISSPIQITNFLKDWLSKHIMGTDQSYSPFLSLNGVQ
jgi:hemerythrin